MGRGGSEEQNNREALSSRTAYQERLQSVQEQHARRMEELLAHPARNADLLNLIARSLSSEQAPAVLKRLSERWAESEGDAEAQNAIRESAAELLFHPDFRSGRAFFKGIKAPKAGPSNAQPSPDLASEVRDATSEATRATLARLADQGDIAAGAWQRRPYPEFRSTRGAEEAFAAAALRAGEIPPAAQARELAARETQLAIERASAQAAKARAKVRDYASLDPAYVRDSLTRLMELHADGRDRWATNEMWLRLRQARQIAQLKTHLEQTGAASLFVDPRSEWQREVVTEFIRDIGVDEKTLWGAVGAVEKIGTPDRTAPDELWTTPQS